MKRSTHAGRSVQTTHKRAMICFDARPRPIYGSQHSVDQLQYWRKITPFIGQLKYKKRI